MTLYAFTIRPLGPCSPLWQLTGLYVDARGRTRKYIGAHGSRADAVRCARYL